jgi:hypothetical protein
MLCARKVDLMSGHDEEVSEIYMASAGVWRSEVEKIRAVGFGPDSLRWGNDAEVGKLSERRRMEHIAILGKTGTGKSSLLRSLCARDIECERGFVYFDLHGDATPFLLRRVALEEQRRRCDLSNRIGELTRTRGNAMILRQPASPPWIQKQFGV